MCNEASINTQKHRVWRASQSVCIHKEIKGMVGSGNREAPGSFPKPGPAHLFYLAIPETDSSIMNQKVNVYVL